MATVLSGNKVKLSNGQIIDAQQGGWYDGQQFWNGSLSGAGQIHSQSNQVGAGQQVSDQVISQSSPDNLSFIRQQREIQANEIQPLTNFNMSVSDTSMPSLNTQVDTYRKQLEDVLGTRKAETDAKLAELRAKEQEALKNIGELSQPFREELEKAERERLYINQNFEANQSLVNELEQLLTEGNDLIRQQQQVTGLASVRNPRIQKTMNDVQARVGVIEAVINARNGQIAQAQNLIDRSANAIAADRNDQINYYKTIISLNERDIISLDAESKKLADYQINLIQQDLDSARQSAEYLKQLMLDPSSASLMGEAGVKLTDSVDVINSKLTQAQYAREIREQSNAITLQGGQPVFDPKSVPANQLASFTDSNGKKHYYKMPATSSGSGSGFDQNSYFQAIASANQMSSNGVDPSYMNFILAETKNPILELRPKFIPQGGPGTIYTDPNTGYTWRHTNDGWEFIG